MTRTFDPGTRRFLKTVGAGAAVLALPHARAMGAPSAGTDYREVKPAQQTDTAGKLEVIEFFWYGCPHCNALEPALKDWAKKLPADVALRKVHVGLGPSWVPHQQLFYTLEAMNKVDELHEKVFHAIHVEKMALNRADAIADFVAKQGVDRKAFLENWESFAVRTRMSRASATAQAYKLDGVPALAVNGKWFTSPSMAGGNSQALRVVDHLLEVERKARR